jgi:TM2 domain-containing membrane protein YozV
MGMMQPYAPFGVDPMTGIPLSDKSRLLAGLLNIGFSFLGIGGVGRFYLGHTGLGVAQLLLGWATCGIWPIVDGILMLMGKVTDAQGRPLRE